MPARSAGTGELERDPDVLDTWFSSALWPFATLGWPAATPELDRYYPGDVNSTAREIIRLWENRMIFSGLFNLGEIPFTDVIIHSTVLAADGRRMSKSLGTGVDPMQPIEAHGADATRYGLLKISSTQDVRYAVGAIEEGRKLANKLWNVARLILQQTEGVTPERRPASLEERWILARLESARRMVEEAWVRLRLRGRDRSALPPHVRRLLRLVRRGDQAASLRRRRGLPRDGAGRARDAALAAPPAHAARDGGDLVAPALQGHTVDRLALAGAGCGGCRRGRAPSIA